MKKVLSLIGLVVLGASAVGCSAEVIDEGSIGESSQALSWSGIDDMGDYAQNPDELAARAFAASCVVTFSNVEYMVVAGGEDDLGGLSAKTFILNPAAAANSQWTKVSDMSTARSRGRMIKLDATRCVMVAGWDGTNYLNTSEVFTITSATTGTWTTVTDTLTDTRRDFALTKCGTKFAAIGGKYASGYRATTEVFTFNSGTPANSTWDILESSGGTDVVLSVARQFPAVVDLQKPSSTNRYLYVAGGDDGGTLYANVDRIEADQNCGFVTTTVTALTDLPTARSQIALIPYKAGQTQILVAAGGQDGATSVINDTRLFDPTTNGGLGSWPAAPSNLGTARAGLVTVKLSTDKYATVGGFFFSAGTNTATTAEQVFDNTAGTPDWLAAGTLGTARKAHVAEFLNSKVYAVGGIDAGGTVLSSVEGGN